jgi:hypothetical protein
MVDIQTGLLRRHELDQKAAAKSDLIADLALAQGLDAPLSGGLDIVPQLRPALYRPRDRSDH